MKTLGIVEKAEDLYARLPQNIKSNLEAYAYGINRGLLEKIENKNAYEFESLRYFPEPWIPQNSAALLLLQSFEQTKENFLRKLDEENWKNEFGEKAAAMFTKTNIPWGRSGQ